MKTFFEKIAIFALLTAAIISVAAVVLPSLPMHTEMFSSANAEPFIGQ